MLILNFALWVGCKSNQLGTPNQILLPENGAQWHVVPPFVMTVLPLYGHVTVSDASKGVVLATCSLGPDLLSARLSPGGESVAWLDRKTLHLVSLVDCRKQSHPWSELWPKNPPAPVRVTWIDNQRLVSYSSPPLEVTIEQTPKTVQIGPKTQWPVSAVAFHDDQLWCGQTDGSVRQCTSPEAVWSLSERIADLETHNGELCAVSVNHLRCGERSWSTSPLELHHPKFHKIGSELWLQDQPAVSQDASSKWFQVEFETGPTEQQAPTVLSWPSDDGWIYVDETSLVAEKGTIPLSRKLTLHARQSGIYFQADSQTHVLNEGNSVIVHPSDCLSITWMQSKTVCVQSETLLDLASGEIIFQGRKIIKYAASNTGILLIHPQGGVTTIDTYGVKSSAISPRHRVSAIALSDDMRRLALGTHTGSVLIWDAKTQSWIESLMYPDDIVSLSWADSTLLVSLMDEPFVVLSDGIEKRGDTVATALAGRGSEIAVATRFNGMQLLSTGRSCPSAVGVFQIAWLNSDLLVWSGETSGVWDLKSDCRVFTVENGRLGWLDNGRVVQSRKDLGE